MIKEFIEWDILFLNASAVLKRLDGNDDNDADVYSSLPQEAVKAGGPAEPLPCHLPVTTDIPVLKNLPVTKELSHIDWGEVGIISILLSLFNQTLSNSAVTKSTMISCKKQTMSGQQWNENS